MLLYKLEKDQYPNDDDYESNDGEFLINIEDYYSSFGRIYLSNDTIWCEFDIDS